LHRLGCPCLLPKAEQRASTNDDENNDPVADIVHPERHYGAEQQDQDERAGELLEQQSQHAEVSLLPNYIRSNLGQPFPRNICS
jgi:hypothetical protein